MMPGEELQTGEGDVPYAPPTFGILGNSAHLGDSETRGSYQ